MGTIDYRLGTKDDLPQVAALQHRYHVDTIAEEDRPDGFVTTRFTRGQFERLIDEERGLSVAVDDGRVVAYAMAASWDYWSAWPLFRFMIDDLPNTVYLGRTLSIANSYQYGPVCLDKPYRGTGMLASLFDFSRRTMAARFPVLITFINRENPRSLAAHRDKLGLDVIKPFDFEGRHYYELGYDTTKPVIG